MAQPSSGSLGSGIVVRDPPAPPQQDPVPFPPRYEPVACLGRGGGGEVWSVRDRVSGRVLAMKILAENAEEAEVQALVREAAMLSGIEGLGVPRVLRFGTLPTLPTLASLGTLSARPGRKPRQYLVRELVEGRSLSDLLPSLSDGQVALRAVADAADLLARLHRALVLHGDLKPANIIVGTDGKATLVDLGLAASYVEGGGRAAGLTPRYAAPELHAGAALTPRAEVFALGVTLDEVLRAPAARFDDKTRPRVLAVAARATSADPAERYPSADEFGSALRGAAGFEGPASTREAPLVWPLLGVERIAGLLSARIAALRDGGGIVVTGPPGSGRSTLLRRLAWGLGLSQRVAWIEGAEEAAGAWGVELDPLFAGPIDGGHDGRIDEQRGPRGAVILVDDADRLGAVELARLGEARDRGAKLVLVLGSSGAGGDLGGPTLEVFAMPALAPDEAAELARRAIPSLPDAVTAHVVRLAMGWPGGLRAIVERIARAPVVSPADVDRLLEEDATPSKTRVDLERLLDKGHFEEAAALLERFQGDVSPEIAIARARLATNQGDPRAALAELERAQARGGIGDGELATSFSLAWARAHLRAGSLPEAERSASEALARLGLVGPAERVASSFDGLTAPLRRMGGELLAVAGLAKSLAARHAEARETLERAVAFARSHGEPRLLSVALGSLAFALQRDGHLPEAKTAYEEALAAAEAAGDAGSVATTRLNLASIAKTQGDLHGALQHLEAAVDMGRRSGRVAALRQALLNLANLDLYLGRTARARSSLDALAKDGAELPPQLAAQLHALEAEHAHRVGDRVTADRECVAAALAYESMGRAVDAAEARLERVLYGAGRAESAAERATALTEGLRDLEIAKGLLGEASAHATLLAFAEGRIAALRGDVEGAKSSFERALETARGSGQRDWVWRSLEARAELALATGETVKARRDREAALVVLEEIAAKLPPDLREVFWNDPRRQALRAMSTHEIATGATIHAASLTLLGDRAQSLDRLSRVLEINRAIAGEVDLERLLEKVTDHAIALLDAERGFVILRTGYRPRSSARADRQSDLSVYASRDRSGDEPHARFSQSIAEQVLSSGQPVVTTSARDDHRMASYVSVHQLMLESVACVPIRARSGAAIGALYLETRLRPARAFADEMGALTAFADQVAIAIETARLVGENARRAEELERANEELTAARAKLEELLGERTRELRATKRDLRSARAILGGHFGYGGLVGTSEAMRRVYALIDRVKDTDIPVLLTGESGTGKEVVARAIHGAGPRSKSTFVGINCGAIPEQLLESELFGHVRGAFTGADRDRKGLFQEATGGTLLLDEIGEMPQKMQPGLLRVLQEKVARPVGGAREEPIDTRIIAATHRDLAQMVEEGAFREDLFYRLHVVELRVPPLRERLEDLPPLIDHFLGIFAARHGRDRRSVSRAALKRLAAYHWPGNVRQLENVLLNGWILSDRPELEPDDFELPSGRLPRPASAPLSSIASSIAPSIASSIAPSSAPSIASPPAESSLDAHKANERERILTALARASWNRVKAAELVGLPRRTFYRRLKEYGIQ